MDDFYYRPSDLAAFIRSMDFTYEQTTNFLEDIWNCERSFLHSAWRDSKRRLVLDTQHCLIRLSNNYSADEELPLLIADGVSAENLTEEYQYHNLNAFFKNARLRILYGGRQSYVAIKRRTLMARYGYKRMSSMLLEYLYRCMEFYSLKPFIRAGVPCRLEDTDIDEMLIFRVV